MIRQKQNAPKCPDHCNLSQLLQSCCKNQQSRVSVKVVVIILDQRQTNKLKGNMLIYRKRIREK